MNDTMERLLSHVSPCRNQLWQLQNGVLQLTVDSANRVLAAHLAADLEQVARALAGAGYPRLEEVLLACATGLLGEAPRAEHLDSLYDLLECLAALDIESEPLLAERLAQLTPALPAGVEVATTPSDAHPAELVDSYEGLDNEDLQLFGAEAREHLQSVESSLLDLERSHQSESIAEVFRAIHSIKGGAQYIGLRATSALAHRMETLLDRLRRGDRQPTPEVMSALLAGVDGLTSLVHGMERRERAGVDTVALVERIERVLQDEPIDGGVAIAPVAVSRDLLDLEDSTPPATAVPPPLDLLDVDRGQPIAPLISSRVEPDGSEAVSTWEPSDVLALVQTDAAPTAMSRPEPPPADETMSDLELFAQEFREGLRTVRELAGDLDLLCRDGETLRVAGRCLHSMKGSAGFVGAREIETLASALDLLLDRMARHRTEAPLDVRRLTSETLVRIEELFESFVAGEPATASAEDQLLLDRLMVLREREERTMTWGESAEETVAPLEETDPLRSRLAAAASAADDVDSERLAGALAELQQTADLQGLDEMAAATAAALAELPHLSPHERRERLAALAALIPADDDLLAAPRPSPGLKASPTAPRSAAAVEPESHPARAFAADPLGDLERRALEDDFDRDLVRIFLETTSTRLGILDDLVARGEHSAAADLLADMAAAAAYMGYEPLSQTLFEAGAALQRPRPAVTEVSALLATLHAGIGRLQTEVARETPRVEGRPQSEAEELEQIFRESAGSHLADLLGNLLALELGAEADRVESITHHLSSLHSAATNLGREDVVAGIDYMHAAVELAVSDGAGALSAATVAELVAKLAALYRLCGLTPPAPAPAPRLAAPPAPATSPETVMPPSPAVDAVPAPRVPAPPAERATEIAPTTLAAEVRMEPAMQDAPVTPAPTETTAEAARALVDAQATVRVDTKKIDDLMNMVAELVVNRSSFMVLSSNIRIVLQNLLESGRLAKVETRDLRQALDRYDEATTDLGRVSNQLQEGVMRIRMMPVRTLLSRVPRLVRDLALREAKQVRVVFSGEETELDKTVIEQLSDPLTHLLRNAITHGIETPAERIAAGKSPEGVLRVGAHHQGNMVIVEVTDDGRGIDFEAVRRGLVERGLGSPAEVARLTPRELVATLFVPGFSTARGVSDVAGRGVGLDVVKRNIEGLGGQIEVHSEPGLSSRFSIRIPLTMAILQALLVRVAGEIYSIPVAAVIQTVKITRREISTLEGQEVINVRQRVVPLVRLSEVFDYRYHAATGQQPLAEVGSDDEALYAVILQGEGREIAIAADGMIGSQDLVIKSLEDELVDARGVAGAAILGDGTVTLILDVAEIQKMAVDRERYRERRMSATVRALERYVRAHPAESGLTV